MKTHSSGSSNPALISGSSASMDPACSSRSSAPSGAMAFEPSQQQLTLAFSSAAGVTTCPNSQDVTAQDVRDAYVSSKTQRAYKGSIPVTARWIRSSKGEEAPRYFSAEGEIDIVQFLARDFEEVLIEQRKSVTMATLSGYRRDIKDLYRRREVALPAAYEKCMAIYISGLKRMQASRLQSGSEKDPLPFSRYQTLGRATLTHHDGAFAHMFLTTQWNLMCRSVHSANTVH
ncbi:hypothetical protein PI124_g21853 [Phytophthora idaei]|nr:hypothetical protein PI125_g23694 [Phytophthora idaei]KAG3127670.1 hypothetical protein PI126_g21742 [Phytophthora idaei]KAG3233069.1 hypothetical protein PI124_g21853 [Phytophthora idaei]